MTVSITGFHGFRHGDSQALISRQRTCTCSTPMKRLFWSDLTGDGPRRNDDRSVRQEDWENPEIQRVGTEPARASFFPFPDRYQAMRNQPLESGWMVPLEGDVVVSVVARPMESPGRVFSARF